MRAIKLVQIVAIVTVLPVSALASHEEKSWTGTLTAVKPGGKVITATDSLHMRTFDLGSHCAVSTMDNQAAALSDLRPGEQVVIRYQSVHGALVANSITEKALRCTGSIQTVDSREGVITVSEGSLFALAGVPKAFRFASNCEVTLRDGRSGSFQDLKPGDRVTIIYELPNGAPIAYRIEDRS
jgi:hypothetical protein